jgi:hypothetical protein
MISNKAALIRVARHVLEKENSNQDIYIRCIFKFTWYFPRHDSMKRLEEKKVLLTTWIKIINEIIKTMKSIHDSFGEKF